MSHQPAPRDNHFDAAGSERAPAIVLVHGSVVTRKMWLPQLRGLSDAHRVLAPDLPGHGALAQEPFTFDSAVRSLADLIRREAGGRALLAGISLGAYISIEVAQQYPDLVSGLVLSGASVDISGGMRGYLKVISWLMRRGWIRQSRAQAEAKTRRLFPPALADVAEAQIQAGVYPEPLGQAFSEMAERDFPAHLAEYPGPVLILNGENDASSRRGEGKFMAGSRTARAQFVPGAGHACNLDQPEAYNRAVKEFAQAIGWAATRAN